MRIVRCAVHGADCTLRGARCTVRGADCTVRGARCTVRGARCGVRGADCTLRGARCPVRGARCVVRGADCTLRGARCVVHGAQSIVERWQGGRERRCIKLSQGIAPSPQNSRRDQNGDKRDGVVFVADFVRISGLAVAGVFNFVHMYKNCYNP